MILLYHLVFPDSTPKDAWNAGQVLRMKAFKEQIHWLKQHFCILSLDEYLAIQKRQKPFSSRKIAITFDDGYRSTFDLVSPFLVEEKVPTTFFITTSHLIDKALLWFVYFNALCFERTYEKLNINAQTFPLISEKTCFIAWRTLVNLARASGDAITFSREYARNYPLPENIIQKYLGLTEEQISYVGTSQILNMGGHTHSHPYLDQISYDQQLSEMIENKRILEKFSKKTVRYFAYTGGIYNADSLAAVDKAGFEAAFAVKPRQIGKEYRYEIQRTDIYSASMLKFKLKVYGLVDLARQIAPWGK
jgi:peptidoglycan/xylan/chitin deacetylase (PgdA/CDA1 family)